MISTAYSKRLCMSEFRVEHAHQRNHHVFDATAGKINSSFGYIVKGSCVCYPIGKSIEVPQGSLFYLPNGVRYRSVWTGSPEIEQYCFHIINHKYSNDAERYYPLQVIPALSTPETGEIFRTIFELFATNERTDRIRALGMYYAFYASVLPYLKAEQPVSYSPAVLAAIAFIEEHYAQNQSVAELAEACFVSESRLYHLFRKEMGISPIKYRNEIRVEKAANELRKRNKQISDIAFECGFNSMTYFYEVFKAHTGMKPSEYQQANA